MDLNLPFRIFAVIVCVLGGFIFPLLFGLAALIAWSIISDIKEEPQNRAARESAAEALRRPISVENIRFGCESPAETAFLDAMVEAYELKTGPGAITGKGLRLRNQVSIGRLQIYRSNVVPQYRADFVVDDKLVVEIDGATYHSSPEAVARDKTRDADMRREGYEVLRIPASTVFKTPQEAVRMVETARRSLQEKLVVDAARPKPSPVIAASAAAGEAIAKTGRGFNKALDDFNELNRKLLETRAVEEAIESLLDDLETVVVTAGKRASMLIKVSESSGKEVAVRERRQIFGDCLKEIAAEYIDPDEARRFRETSLSRVRRLSLGEASKAANTEHLRRSVEQHVESLKAAHDSVFQGTLPFLGGAPTAEDMKSSLTKSLEQLIFEGADSTFFRHPYTPAGPISIHFLTWWQDKFAGDAARFFKATQHQTETTT